MTQDLPSTDAQIYADTVIVFDLDGTLIDTAPDLAGAASSALLAFGHPPVDPTFIKPFVGFGGRVMLAKGLEALGEPVSEAELDRMIEVFLQHYRARIADESRPFPGVLAAMDQLGAQGARFAICTNKREAPARLLLETLGLTALFASIVGADTCPTRKPEPESLRHAMAQSFGAPSYDSWDRQARAVMIGDTVTDLGAARAAGVPVVLVDFGYSDVPVTGLGADAVISHFDALPSAVAEVLAGVPAGL